VGLPSVLLKAPCPFVIAENPQAATQPSKPLSAIKTGDVDYILPRAEIAPTLRRLDGAVATQDAG
jgi:hypothetical protein